MEYGSGLACTHGMSLRMSWGWEISICVMSATSREKKLTFSLLRINSRFCLIEVKESELNDLRMREPIFRNDCRLSLFSSGANFDGVEAHFPNQQYVIAALEAVKFDRDSESSLFMAI